MSTLISNLNTIESCKLDIKSAIEAKGVDMTSASLPDYAACIASISGGGGGYSVKDLAERTYQFTGISDSGISFVSAFAFTGTAVTGSINLPNCTTIGSSAFFMCGIEEVSLPNCRIIDASAFGNCQYLSSVYIPMCSNIGNFAFTATGLETIYAPKCSTIWASCFMECMSLTSVDLPVCKSIFDGAFLNCINLVSVSLPNCRMIFSQVFANCESLTSVSLPVIEVMDSNMFSHCTNLSELTLGTETYFIPPYGSTLDYSPFSTSFYSEQLSIGDGYIYVDAAQYDKWVASTGWSDYSAYFSSVGNMDPMLSFDATTSTLYGKTRVLNTGWHTYVGTQKSRVSYISFSNLTVVDKNMFSGCNNLLSVTLNNCTYISANAFRNCNLLSAINLPGSVVCSLFDASPNTITYNASIFVPVSLYSDYCSADYWSTISSRIVSVI